FPQQAIVLRSCGALLAGGSPRGAASSSVSRAGRRIPFVIGALLSDDQDRSLRVWENERTNRRFAVKADDEAIDEIGPLSHWQVDCRNHCGGHSRCLFLRYGLPAVLSRLGASDCRGNLRLGC